MVIVFAGHRRIGEPACQRVRVRRGRRRRRRHPLQLHARCGGERHVAHEVHDVGKLARQVVAAHLGERPDDVAGEHGSEAGEQQQRHALPAEISRAGKEQHTEHQEHHAVEREIGLAQHLLEKIDLVLLRGRAQHQEPEERTEAHREDRRIHRELDPGHAHRGGADQEDRRSRQGQVEGTIEKVSRTGKRIEATQPGADPDAFAQEVERDCTAERDPGAAQVAGGRTARRDRTGDDGRERRGQRPQEPHVVPDRRPANAREHPSGACGRVDHQARKQPIDPARSGLEAARLRSYYVCVHSGSWYRENVRAQPTCL
jgi:DNA primase